MKISFLCLILICLVFTPLASQAETVITNSVSVSTNNVINTTKIKTIHNGEVIEDINISTTTPYHYESNYQNKDKEIAVFTQTSSNITEDDGRITQLKMLLDQLQKLLVYYEKLLAEQNS